MNLELSGLAEYAPRVMEPPYRALGTREIWLVRHNGQRLWILPLAHADIVDEVVATADVERSECLVCGMQFDDLGDAEMHDAIVEPHERER